MKDKSQWLEYIITVRPGYIHDIEGMLKDIKNKHKEFEYVIERAEAQTSRSEYILGITPTNFKLLREKIYLMSSVGSISPIIILTLVRKSGDNLQIGLDKKDINVYLGPDILDILDTDDIKKELIEINMLIMKDEDIVKMQEEESSIKFERTDINVKLRQYNKESKLYFIRKDDKLKNYSSDVYIPVGANWETLFGFYFEEDIPIKVHVYYVGKEFDLDKLSEMIYSLFTDIGKDHIKIGKIAFKYNKGVIPDKEFEKSIIGDIMDKKENV